MPLKTVEGQRLYHVDQIRADSINKEKRTIEVVFTTGYKGKRSGWESYYEELAVDEKSVRMQRLQSGTSPVLAAHDSWSLNSVIGVVESARIENGVGYATMRFSADEDADRIWRKIGEKVLGNVSVGYKVHKYEDVSGPDDKIRTYRATDWEPVEISIVPIGFDPGAQVRSGETGEAHTIEIITRGEPMIDKNNDKNVDTGSVAEASAPVDEAKIRKEAAEGERRRVAEIMTSCRKADLPANFAEKLIADGTELDAARAMIIDEVAERREKGTETTTVGRVEMGGQDEIETRRAAVENSLLHRYKPEAFPLTDAGKQWRGMTLLETCRDLLEQRGVRTRGMDKLEIARRSFQSTSDFDGILYNVANKSLRNAYELAPATYLPITRVVEVPDFKEIARAQLGEGSTLDRVYEGGEYKYGSVSDDKETYYLYTYGKLFSITRQAIINDDLDAFTRMPAILGRRAADKVNSLVWAVITANAAMADSVALFHSTHANLSAAAADPSTTTLNTARKAMRIQTGLDGATLNITPKYLIVPAALEATAQAILNSVILPESVSNANVFYKTMEPIVEPILDASSVSAWYLAASLDQIDMLELAYLQGNRGAYLETKDGWDVDGVDYKVRLDCGAAVIDHRGLYKYFTS